MRLGFLLASLTIASICIASPPVTIQQPSTANTWVLASCAWMLFLLLNALFIASEAAIGQLRSTHVRHARETVGVRAYRLQHLIDKRQKFVTATLLASRLSRLGLFITCLLVAPTLASLIDNGPVGLLKYFQILPAAFILGAPILVVNLLVGELVPRSFATLHPHRVGLALYPLVKAAAFVLSLPASLMVGTASIVTARFGGEASFAFGAAEEEIKNLVETAQESGEIQSDERELIHSVLEFNDKVAREIMTPRVDLDAAPVNTDPLQLIKMIEETGHSRIPLYEETDDQIVGIVHAKDLLSALAEGKETKLRDIMRPALFVPEGKSIHELLQEMRAARSQMAIIQDEFGGTAGIVTSEDIVEQLVGEIVDEYDEEEPDITTLENAWRVSGKAHVDDVNDALGSEFEDSEFDTIGGLVFGHFGRQPRANESIEIENYLFTVEETDGRRILRLRIEPVGLQRKIAVSATSS
jgi:putative hemolysin